MGWFANIFIVLGMLAVGQKDRRGFLWCTLGEGLWVFHATYIAEYDLAAICVLFCIVNILNFYRWKHDASTSDSN